MENAIVLCEGKFGTSTGKTANGLVRYSKRFQILGVIDSTKAGQDAGVVLDGKPKGIPIFRNLKEALNNIEEHVEWLIIGVATVGGRLPPEFRPIINEALINRMNVIAGLHEFLAEDPEFSRIAYSMNVKIVDIRKCPPIDKLHHFQDKVRKLNVIRIPILGTDGSIGKRTTGIFLTEALNEAGIKTTFVATGQTGILQGAKYGIPLDAISPDYMVGELENVIVEAYENEKPKIIIIEGQGALSHPAYVCGSRAIVMASQPNAVICQHAPKRVCRNYHKETLCLPMPPLEKEIKLIHTFAETDVIGIALNHESMTDDELEFYIRKYEDEFKVPVTDVLKHGCEKFVNKIKEKFEKEL